MEYIGVAQRIESITAIEPISLLLLVLFGLGLLLGLFFLIRLAMRPRQVTPPPPPPPPVQESEGPSAEREKILELLEQGKITADEGAELLNALGQSVPPPITEQSSQINSADQADKLLKGE